jgi:hypothetical protein
VAVARLRLLSEKKKKKLATLCAPTGDGNTGGEGEVIVSFFAARFGFLGFENGRRWVAAFLTRLPPSSPLPVFFVFFFLAST